MIRERPYLKNNCGGKKKETTVIPGGDCRGGVALGGGGQTRNLGSSDRGRRLLGQTKKSCGEGMAGGHGLEEKRTGGGNSMEGQSHL